MAERKHITHPIPPTYDSASEILILGSFPSVKSREMMYFYGHPQNRFWKVMARIFDEPVPMSVCDRRDFLIRNHIAAWGVIGECDIIGSACGCMEDCEEMSKAALMHPQRTPYVRNRTRIPKHDISDIFQRKCHHRGIVRFQKPTWEIFP